MTQPDEPTPGAFAYQAQAADETTISGTIDARDAAHATQLLQRLGLRVIELSPTARSRPAALKGENFLAFNQQLTHLTRAGLPVEQGLRLIAQDMRSRRLGETIRQVADDLDHGIPLDQAFARHANRFPPLYGQLIGAGVASGDLPGMLVNLGKHLELVQHLRAALWRALAYPLMVLLALALVVIFLGLFILPQFEQMFKSFGVVLPAATQAMLTASRFVPILIILFVVIVIVFPLIWLAFRAAGIDSAVVDRLVLPIPLIGPVLKRNLIARWCDAVRLGVSSSLDLPRAIGLADEAIGSPRLRRDGQLMIAMLESGQNIDAAVGRTSLIPATIPTAMALSQQDLPGTLSAMSRMYQQQAETSMGTIPMILTPLLILLIAVVIGFVMTAMFMPFITLIRGMTGGM